MFFIFIFLWCYVFQQDIYATYWYHLTGSADYPNLLVAITASTLVSAIYYGIMWSVRRHLSDTSRRTFWLKQSAVTIILMLLVGIFGKTDEVLHLELATARYCAARDYEQALEIGSRYQKPTTTLTALRTYALLQLDETTASNAKVCSVCFTALPAHFFEYVHRDGEQHLMLTPTQRKALQPYGREIGRYDARAQRDIDLITLLLRRDLKGFVDKLTGCCHITSTPLPRAYAEALVLYQRTTSAPLTDYRDSAIEANYRDFRDLESRTLDNHIVRANTLSENYRDTYWWYYYYGDVTAQ